MIYLFTPDVFHDPVKVGVIETVVRRLYPRGGLIVVALNSRTNEYHYWNKGALWEFDDDTRMEDPKVYRTIHTVRAACKRVEREYLGDRSFLTPEVALWVHPDAGLTKPMEKYVKMATGFLLPGCPTQ